jgi:hypothetical protein
VRGDRPCGALPAIYAYRSHVMSGGLMSYSIDMLEQHRQAASYDAPSAFRNSPGVKIKFVNSADRVINSSMRRTSARLH